MLKKKHTHTHLNISQTTTAETVLLDPYHNRIPKRLLYPQICGLETHTPTNLQTVGRASCVAMEICHYQNSASIRVGLDLPQRFYHC